MGVLGCTSQLAPQGPEPTSIHSNPWTPAKSRLVDPESTSNQSQFMLSSQSSSHQSTRSSFERCFQDNWETVKANFESLTVIPVFPTSYGLGPSVPSFRDFLTTIARPIVSALPLLQADITTLPGRIGVRVLAFAPLLVLVVSINRPNLPFAA